MGDIIERINDGPTDHVHHNARHKKTLMESGLFPIAMFYLQTLFLLSQTAAGNVYLQSQFRLTRFGSPVHHTIGIAHYTMFRTPKIQCRFKSFGLDSEMILACCMLPVLLLI